MRRRARCVEVATGAVLAARERERGLLERGAMRAGWAIAFVMVGCAAPGTAIEAELAGSRWSAQPPAWIDRAAVIERDGALVLLALDAPDAPPQSDVRPARAIVAARDGLHLAPPEPVIAARIAGGAIAWVTVEGALLLDDGAVLRTLDRDAIPELAVSPDRRTLAWAERPGPEAGVRTLALDVAGAQPRLVTRGLAIADRPLFAGDATLIVVGSVPSGIAGIWRIDLARGDRVAITNAALRTGSPLGPTFVPPPADHASMRIEDGVLVYDDGEREQRVEVLR